tara:strand:- start:306 stop:614 length:309 start_codon:yes stop_codon:yes gene_type:complete
MSLSIKNLSVFIDELLIEWSDGSKNSLDIKTIRLSCPCAGCSGESDVLGNKYFSRQKKLTNNSYLISRFEFVGLYGVRFFWKDGHHDGIYTYSLLGSLDNKK